MQLTVLQPLNQVKSNASALVKHTIAQMVIKLFAQGWQEVNLSKLLQIKLPNWSILPQVTSEESMIPKPTLERQYGRGV
jgi:hypothetical protein